MADTRLLDPANYRVTPKNPRSRRLNDAQVKALAQLVRHQGDLTALDVTTRTSLAGLQARVATDPGIAGAAVIIDFSVRAVSIHKTWSVFKNFKSSDEFDPITLPRVDLNLSNIVRRR